jgi:hypothetical protein
MKLSCYVVALVVLLAGSVQMVRAQRIASQPVFCPDQTDCVPVNEVQWLAAYAGQ